MSKELLENENVGIARRTKVIGLAGRKGSGKDASARFIAGINLVSHGYIEEFKSLPNGTLEIGGKKLKDLNSIAPNFVKIYHFADFLKEICERVLGISAHALHVNKASSTKLRWENMPGVVADKEVFSALKKFADKKVELYGSKYELPLLYHDPGLMRARDVLQFLGTEVFRRMATNCWIDCLQKTIEKENPAIAIIADCRFVNELQMIKDMGGLCIRLTRGSDEDGHSSEIDFLSYKEWDATIDNRGCEDMRCLNKMLYEGLSGLGVFEKIDL